MPAIGLPTHAGAEGSNRKSLPFPGSCEEEIFTVAVDEFPTANVDQLPDKDLICVEALDVPFKPTWTVPEGLKNPAVKEPYLISTTLLVSYNQI